MAELIDRQAALKKMCETCGYCEKFEKSMRATHPDFVTDKCNNYKFLAELPTIKPEVQHGRWIKQHTDYGSKWNCSVCCISIRVGDGISFEIERFAFCPFCGAQMDLRTPTEVQIDEADDVMMGGADNG